MAKNRQNTNDPRLPNDESRGYRPVHHGYQPARDPQTPPSEQSPDTPPEPPTGGTGQSGPSSDSDDKS